MKKKELYEELLWHLDHTNKYTIDIVITPEEKKLIKAEIGRSNLSGTHIVNSVSKRIENLDTNPKNRFLPFKISDFIRYISGYSHESLEEYKSRKKTERENEKLKEIERKRLKDLPDYYSHIESNTITNLMLEMVNVSNCSCNDNKEDIIFTVLKSRVSIKRILYGLSTRLKKGTSDISLVKYINYLNRIKSEALITPEEKTSLKDLHTLVEDFKESTKPLRTNVETIEIGAYENIGTLNNESYRAKRLKKVAEYFYQYSSVLPIKLYDHKGSLFIKIQDKYEDEISSFINKNRLNILRRFGEKNFSNEEILFYDNKKFDFVIKDMRDTGGFYNYKIERENNKGLV